MLIKKKRGWELPESAATPESVYLNRRNLMKTMAVGGALLAGSFSAAPALAAADESDDPSAGLYPVKRNPKYTLDRAITDERWSTSYNNFYEFGTDKSIARAAQKLPVRPWTVEIGGMVDKPMTIDIDDLLKKMPLEERLYRHRCVETWAMAVPWSGFPLKALVEMAKPTSGAKFVKMTTFKNPAVAPMQKGIGALQYPWPYIEGVTMAEAMNDMAFMVTGMYGHPVPKQDGAPLRLAVPWKYGFKSVKSIVKIEFTSKQPLGMWQNLQSNEYGFWANVNPAVPHPRWSQASEELLGTHERVPTQLYNGYGEFVADLYKDMKQDRALFM
jgi:methionine sulfoxide reductase catalytic subunit